MGRMAFTIGGEVVGAAAGFMLGGPAGAMMGASLGGMAGGLIGGLVNQDNGGWGAKIDDLRVTSSAWGTPIAWGWGTYRIGGNVIWSTRLFEHKQGALGKGSMGGSGGYEYTVSFAVAFGRGVISDVLTIWADTKIIYDKRIDPSLPGMVGATQPPGTTFDKTLVDRQSSGNLNTNLKFRFYQGTETQLPDPAIEADPRITAGYVPGFRGLAYIVFEDLLLSDFGNRIPNISALVTYEGSDQTPYQCRLPATASDGTQPSFADNASYALDPARGIAYGFTGSGASGYLSVLNLATMQTERSVPLSAVLATPLGQFDQLASFGSGVRGFTVDANGYLYGLDFTGSDYEKVVKIDPNSLKEVARSAAYWCPGLFAAFGSNYLITGGFVADALRVFDTGALATVWTDPAGNRGVLAGFAPVAGSNQIYVVIASGTTLSIYLVSVVAGTASIALSFQTSVTALLEQAGVDPTTAATYTGFANGSGVVVLDSDGGLVVFIAPQTAASRTRPLVFKWLPGAAACAWANSDLVNWGTDDLAMPQPSYQAFNVDGRLQWIMEGELFTLDTVRGAVSKAPWPNVQSEGVGQGYDGAAQTGFNFLLAPPAPPAGYQADFVKSFYAAAGGGSATVGTIITDICEETGLQASDLDLTRIEPDAYVLGYYIGRPTTARDALGPLQAMFMLDFTESDYVLKVVPRGAASARTITQSDLCKSTSQQSGDEWIVEKRVQEFELPLSYGVSYVDGSIAYNPNTQIVQRTRFPVPTMRSNNRSNITLPVVMDPLTAHAIGEKLLYSIWTERSTYGWATGWTHADLDPTDVVTLQMDDGTVFTPRLETTDLGVDLTCEFSGKSQVGSTYTASDHPGVGAAIPYTQTIPSRGIAKLFVFDLPLLRDQDDTAGSGSCVYLAAAGYGSGSGWPGGAVYGSPDNVTWTLLTTIPNPVTWGSTGNALPPNADPFSWDTTTQLTVYLASDSDALASVSDDAVLSSAANAFAVQNGSAWEVIQAANVVLNADGSYTLSRLLRGRRGSDTATDNHAAGDLVVYLSAAELVSVELAIADLNVTRYYRCVTSGTLPEDAQVVTAVNTGADLKPYAPTHVSATLNGSSDIVLSWVRRTRLAGGLVDYTGTVPLAEATESYSIDVMSGPATGVVKRTLTASTPSVIYPNAEILADFGAVPSSITVRVYQISAVIGRGFTREATLGVS